MRDAAYSTWMGRPPCAVNVGLVSAKARISATSSASSRAPHPPNLLSATAAPTDCQ
jgi:hypothetical protein